MAETRRSPGSEARATSTTATVGTTDYTAGRDRFRRSWRRQFFYDCGCSLPCRCSFHGDPTPKRVDAYREAAEHLESVGLAPAALLLCECDLVRYEVEQVPAVALGLVLADPDVARVISYADPTGESAVRNVMAVANGC